VESNLVFLAFLTKGTPFVKGSHLAPKLKLRLLKIEKLRSRSAPLQNRLTETGARSEQLSHAEGWVKKVRNTQSPVLILP